MMVKGIGLYQFSSCISLCVSLHLLCLFMTVSKNVVDLVSKSNDAKNLMVGCKVLILTRNSLNSSREPVQRIKILSMKRLKNKIGSGSVNEPKVLPQFLMLYFKQC